MEKKECYNCGLLAGRKRFKDIRPMYYKYAAGVVLCYDTNEKESFDSLGLWIDEIKQYAPDDCHIILVGCKSDLREET
eukprot:UN01004